MRNAFAQELTEIALKDPRVMLLSGDIGNRLFNDFRSQCPDHFLNCGIAEANMTTMAAGLALSGLRPITYTIAPFCTMRCFEQIRVDICYQKAPVIIVGVGAGLSYANLGPTHHSCEDIACLRSLPNMKVVCPGDAVETRLALGAALKEDGPVYIRLGKKGEPMVHLNQDPTFEIGKALEMRRGTDVCLLNTGTTLPLTLEVASFLECQGLSVGVLHFHTVKPLDTEALGQALRYPLLASIEEHSLAGGFGSHIAEWMIDNHLTGSRLLRFGTPDRFHEIAGEQSDAREHLGLSVSHICQKILSTHATLALTC